MHKDDVIVIGHTFQENLVNLWKGFQRFREARLKFNPEKCQLLQKKVQYLGHTVPPKGIRQPQEAESCEELTDHKE
jgi:hypothetical protein